MSDVRIALLLACGVAVLLAGFHRSSFSSSDEAGAYEITRSLVEEGSLRVPAIRHSYPGRDGGRYSHFAIGQPVLAIPFYWLGSLAEALLPEAAVRALAGPGARLARIERTYHSPEIFTVLLYPPLATGLLVGLFFGFERRLGASRRSALLASALLATCSYVALMSTFFLRHTSEAILVLGSFFAFFLWRNDGRIRFLALGSGLASLLLLVRVPAAAAGVGLAGYLVWTLLERLRGGPLRRSLGALAAIAAPFLVVLAAYLALNQQLWGSWLDSPMVGQRSRFGWPSPSAGFGLLLSPGTGLVWYSPLLLLLPATTAALWTRWRAEVVTVLATSLGLLVFIACFDMWHGLWGGPGPRYLFCTVPLLMLPLGPWLDRASQRVRRRIVAPLAVAGGLVQLSLMTTHWWSLVQHMGYTESEPRWSFLFSPSQSPILAALTLRSSGIANDSWWLRLATGWPGEAPHPAAAAILLLIWLATLTLFYRRLQKELT